MKCGADSGPLSLPTFCHKLFRAPPVRLGEFAVMRVEIYVRIARNLGINKRLLLTNKVRIPLLDVRVVPAIGKLFLHHVENGYFVGTDTELFLSFANGSLHSTLAGIDAALNTLPSARVFFIDAFAEQNISRTIGDDDGNIRAIAFNVAHIGRGGTR